MEKEKKSLKLNMLLNAIKNLMAIIFPLLSFPYVSKTLGVESLGEYNFAASLITYITLIAGLGIETYAIREGAKYRDDKEKMGKFASQIFSINIISTIFALLILLILLVAVPKFQGYIALLTVLSTQVVFTTLGVNWIFSLYEEFAYITIRSIIFQILAIIAMFMFIKTPDDVLIYALITAGVVVVSNTMNFFFARKHCRIKITFDLDWKKHFKPILILFVSIASITIYTSSDTTILGFISGEYAVGIYTVAHKIYFIIKNLLFSAIVVTIPRMALLLGQKRNDEANEVSSSVLGTTVSLVVPVIVGLIALSREVIVLISDEDYISAIPAHSILTVAIIFSMGGYFWGHAVLIPAKEEKYYLKITIISALVNILLNFALVPFFAEVAAATTTLIAEIVAFLMCYFKGKRYVQTSGLKKIFIKSLVGAGIIIPVSVGCKLLIADMFLYTVAVVVVSVVLYLFIEVLLKNQAVTSITQVILKKFRRRVD
jgi:O-antigen/teichoic acid export membrane protein